MDIIIPILHKILQIWKSKVFGFQITYAKYSNQKRWLWSGVYTIDHNSISITEYYNRINSFKLRNSDILYTNINVLGSSSILDKSNFEFRIFVLIVSTVLACRKQQQIFEIQQSLSLSQSTITWHWEITFLLKEIF